MRVITVNINKGGTGKSTFSYNFTKWLSNIKEKKVLLIDGDSSCNLSYSFNKHSERTIFDVFESGKFDVVHIDKNLDFINGSALLTDDTLELRRQQNNCLIMFMWIADNIEILSNYDFIIIDTHNDASLVTSNFIAVADLVLGISEPSRNGYRAWLELQATIDDLKENVVDIMTRKSYVQAEPYLIGNKIEHIGNTSKDFLNLISEDKRYIGYLPKKELLAKSLLLDKDIFEQKKKMTVSEQKRNEQFFSHVNLLFDNILNTI